MYRFDIDILKIKNIGIKELDRKCGPIGIWDCKTDWIAVQNFHGRK